MSKSGELRRLLNSSETLVMPDAYDAISARIIERAGFKAVQCSGGSIAMAACCRTEADLSVAENIEATRGIVDSVSVPVMADGEDGYGDAEAVRETVRRYVKAGVAGINIEDLVPCRTTECRIADTGLMLEKIAAARESATASGDPDLIINARTDALRAFPTRDEGLGEAIRRANMYLDAGADLAFICYTATLDEAETLANEVHGPISIAAGLPYNIRAFSIDDLRRLRVARVSLPMVAIMSSIRALMASISLLHEPDGLARIADESLYCSREDIGELLRG